MSNEFYSINLYGGANKIEFFVKAGLAANYNFVYPNEAPENLETLVWNAAGSSFQWVSTATFGSGTVTSVALTVPSQFTVGGSPITTGGTLALGWANQTANLVLASPNGATGVPLFRKLVDADIDGLAASKLSGTLNRGVIPNGTDTASWQIGSTGVTLKNDPSGSLSIFGASGLSLSNLIANSLTLADEISPQTGTQTNFTATSLRLQNDITTGTPTSDANLSIRRGSSVDAQLVWNETSDVWQIGIVGAIKTIARRDRVAITNANISGGTYTFVHNLGLKPSKVQIITDLNREINLSVEHSSVNQCVIDFSKAGAISGTWEIIAIA